MRCALACALLLAFSSLGVANASHSPVKAYVPATSHRLTAAARAFRVQTYRAHPCLAHIIDGEDGDWDPTISYGGGHNTSDSYGLGQANPGTKMASYGPLWATDRPTQLRWALAYAQRYGGECGAWAFWQGHRWW